MAFYVINRAIPEHIDDAGTHGRSDKKEQLQSFEQLKNWALTDAEVAHPHQDLFGHDAIARRIARRLADESPGRAPTIAVIGDRGSGKSTIGRLVAYNLRPNPRMLFVRASLWPFDSTEAAVRGILDKLVRGLGTRVNTLSLTGLPERYAAAVEKLGPWAFIPRMFRQSSNPQEIVEQVDPTARAIGVRIVLWIEDLERFSVSATMEGESAALSEEERLGPVRALLWLLNECERIGVVVADASLRSRFDVDKIARFIERVPPLDLDQAGAVLSSFRHECLTGYPKTVIDPLHSDERAKFKPSEALVRSLRYYVSSDQDPEPFDALIDIVRTPRSLKNVLRWTLETWEQLPGEIDLDHVIAASALRSRYPEVFEFIDTNIHWFRRGFRTSDSQANDPTQHQANLAFEELLGQPAFQAVSAPIRSLVRFVFPALPQGRVIADVDRQYLARPQGLNIEHDWIGSEPVDYWDRYLQCAPVPDEHSDQRALRQIEAWREGEGGNLLAYLTDGKHNGQIEAFLNQFRFSDLLRLLAEVVEREQRGPKVNWSDFGSPPGGVSVWRMLNHCGVRDSARVASKLEEILQGVVPAHLPYANFLFHYFCVPSQGSTVFPLTESDDTKRLAESVRERLLGSLASALPSALKHASPYLLGNFLQDIKRGCGFTGDQPVEGWEQFSETLLDFAERAPSTGIPIILTFVTSHSDRLIDSWDDETGERLPTTRLVQYQFQEDAAKKLFDWNRLRAMLAEQCVPPELDDGIREMWTAAKQAAIPGTRTAPPSSSPVSGIAAHDDRSPGAAS